MIYNPRTVCALTSLRLLNKKTLQVTYESTMSTISLPYPIYTIIPKINQTKPLISNILVLGPFAFITS